MDPNVTLPDPYGQTLGLDVHIFLLQRIDHRPVMQLLIIDQDFQ